jgi:hypothetical protein
MNFSQYLEVLPEFNSELSDGYHVFPMSDDVAAELADDPEFLVLTKWLDSVGLTLADLRIRKSGRSVTMCNPGIWLVDGEPVLLLGFKDSNPLTAPLPVLIQKVGNLYSIMFDEETLPLQARLNTDNEYTELPVILSYKAAKTLAKPLNAGGKQQDWVKFRDTVEDDSYSDFTVIRVETKNATSKDGKQFTVYLLHTSDKVFSVNEKQYGRVKAMLAYAKFVEKKDTPVIIRVTHVGMWQKGKVFDITLSPAID